MLIPSIVKRGGGIREIWVEEKSTNKERFYIFYASLDTNEAMGANMLNTILEGLFSPIGSINWWRVLWLFSQILQPNSVVTLDVSSHQESWIRELLKVKIDRSNRFSK